MYTQYTSWTLNLCVTFWKASVVSDDQTSNCEPYVGLKIIYCNYARKCMKMTNLDVWRFVGLLAVAAAKSPELQCLNLLAVLAGLNKSNSIDLTETDWDVDMEGLHLGNIHNR